MASKEASSGEQELRTQELADALRTSAMRYRDLLERNLAGVYRSTVDGRILEVNPAFARIFGFDGPEALADVPAQSLYLDATDREANLYRLRQDGAMQAGEMRMRRRDGSPVWVIYSEQLRAGDDGVEVIEGTLLDATAHKEAEARMLQAGRLAAVGTLAAGVAHEVNNPLAGILANLGYALETLPAVAAALPPGSPVRETAHELVAAMQDARDAAERVRDTIRHLRLFARAEEEGRAPLDVARVLDATLALLATQLRHRARLERHFEAAPQVSGNESRLAQAFLNLLLNAIQAVPEGGAADHVIRVGLGTGADGQVRVEIADDGAGMSQEVLARAFDPYYSTHADPGGGMGLPTARAIINSLGGTLTLESAPGSGTVARVLLPAAPVQVPGQAQALPAGSGRRRLLVIDDEPVVGRSLARLLPGHELTLATGGHDALTRLALDQGFDAILCDLMMPDLGGEAVYRAIEERWPALTHRVIFMTGGAPDAGRRAFLAACRRPLLEKPFDLARVADALAQTLAS